MVELDWLGLLAPVVMCFAACALIGYTRLPHKVKVLLCIAVFLRICGASIYYGVMSRAYGGGDFLLYHKMGTEYSERIANHDFAMFTNPQEWSAGRWWGTQFLFFLSGLVMLIIGPNMLGAFMIFAILGFLGLLCFVVAFQRSFGDSPLWKYMRWICLFPSLWFWPSVLGKEPIVLLGLGISTLAYVGKRDHVRWPMLVVGLCIVFAVRPQVASVFAASMLIAHWLSFEGKWSVKKSAQGVILTIFCVSSLWAGSKYLGLGLDVQGMTSYIRTTADIASVGVMNARRATVSWQGVPMALVNILFRPFPWETRNLTTLLSSFEIVLLWGVLIAKRKVVLPGFRRVRQSRFGRISIPFILLYSVMLGMVVVNLGIIARQRIFLFPFIFVLLEAGKQAPARRRPTGVPLRSEDSPIPTVVGQRAVT